VSIAAAMEEQGAATGEIARSVQEAARGTEHITGNIGNVRRRDGGSGFSGSERGPGSSPGTRSPVQQPRG
jgi:hypothetical protein